MWPKPWRFCFGSTKRRNLQLVSTISLPLFLFLNPLDYQNDPFTYLFFFLNICLSLNLPENFLELSGVTDGLPENITIENSNDIQKQFEGGNATASDTLSMLNFLIDRVYHSSGDVASNPYGCEFNGLAKLKCSRSKPTLLGEGVPLRSVTMAGALVPANWATGGKELSLNEAKDFYNLKDFHEMKSIGLNTVQIPTPTAAFDPNNESGSKIMMVLEGFLENIEKAGLQAIINLVSTGDELDAVVSASAFCSNSDAVLAMTLPAETRLDAKTMITAIRAETSTLPIFIPLNQGDLMSINGEYDENIYGALELSHTVSVGDVASSTSDEDRSKLFYHEATSCMARSPMEYSECYSNLPLFLASGFDLSIDDCVHSGQPSFKDYGQCDRFNETVTSDFWHRHRASFAARQLFAYEQGMGWSFATWKLYNNDNVGTLDDPAKLLSLQDVVAAGLFPDLVSDSTPAVDACLNPPLPDFVMGDKTYAPTLGPPPDCGDGWWNYTTEVCDYWIPPTPTPTEPCPTCEDCNVIKAAFGGALVGGILVLITAKFMGAFGRRDYSRIPN